MRRACRPTSMSWFRKASPSDPLAVTMAGVRLGDRVLAVGVGDVPLVAAIAIKAGLTGRAAAVDAGGARVSRGAGAIEREGALVEVTHAPWDTWPYEAESFDVVVVRDVLAEMSADVRDRCLHEVYRVLRQGGRIVVIEPSPRGGGAFGMFSRQPVNREYTENGGAVAALQARGFAGVRVLADQNAMLFVEAARRAG